MTTAGPAAAPAGSPTLGVEEEFLLVDPETGRPCGKAAQVLERVRQAGGDPDRFQRELLTSQVESTTAVCEDTAEAAGQLWDNRRALAEAARSAGVALLPSATAPFPGERVPLSEGARFRRIHSAHREAVADYQVCGCHIHVGVPDAETAVQIVDRVRPWLPTLLALSVNSPYHLGRDTGFASWRLLEQARLPGSGIPPLFGSAAGHREEVARLTAYGCLVDERMSFWLVRPSPRWPTVEFRVADTAASVDEAVLQAALARALVTTAHAAVLEGRPPAEFGNQTAAAAVWAAARHGLRGAGVDPWAARPVPAQELAQRLLAEVDQALRASGDQKWVAGAVEGLLDRGTGAERQLRAGARGRQALLTQLTRDLLRPVTGAPAIAAPPGTAPVRHPRSKGNRS
ncbi:glutamate--cysteine ligase [Streptomyces sp. P38-E01]|uniref:Putative glutamate--cysteine ligase 2 n=1 Tax=Streptomyces tardus TaxID=2780544 RepID=A0A949JT41_9ACTN|nr:glutamate--cysteine ligase [Streptomyces tardus]MBU7600751.1 glutamate--cysteine ligase [Streptomyces tardus]